MQILVKVETGFNCNWRNIEPLQPEGFKGQTENEKETLKNSIVKNGFHDAFDVWKHDNKLLSIDGVHRKIALLELAAEGYEIPEQMPCTYVTAENETEAATIILSRNSQHSHIIRAAVLMEACAIPAKMIEAVVPQKNLEAWSESDNSITEQLTAEEDDFEFEDGGIETDIVIGDLFEIGEHRLLCGDSTCSDTVAKLMNGQKADMVFTDPPFPNNSEIMHEMIKNIDSAFNNSRIFCDGLMIWFWDNLEFPPFLEQVTSKHIWHKTNGWQAGHFETMYCYHNDSKRHEQKVYSINNVGGENNREEQGNHPTPKPISLVFNIVNDLSKNSKLILDLFLGSGTTMVASHQLNRKCYGMELDPKYCQVIIDRMRKLDPTLIIKRNGVIYE